MLTSSFSGKRNDDMVELGKKSTLNSFFADLDSILISFIGKCIHVILKEPSKLCEKNENWIINWNRMERTYVPKTIDSSVLDLGMYGGGWEDESVNVRVKCV